MQNRGTCCLKKVFEYRKIKEKFYARKSKEITSFMKMCSTLKILYKGRPSNNLFQLFLKLKGRPEENSSYFANVQPCTITCTLDAFIK